MAWRALTDAQWERIRPQLPREKRHRRGGRPRADPRRCFEGILWILWTGAPWSELPARYGSPTTCWRRLRAVTTVVFAHPQNTSRASSVTSPCFIRRSGIGAMLHPSITVASRHRRATTSSGFTGGAWFPQLVRSWLRTAATSSLVSWSANAGMGDG